MIDLTRRRFLIGVGLVGIAPAIVKADAIMRIREPKLIPFKFSVDQKYELMRGPFDLLFARGQTMTLVDNTGDVFADMARAINYVDTIERDPLFGKNSPGGFFKASEVAHKEIKAAMMQSYPLGMWDISNGPSDLFPRQFYRGYEIRDL